MRALDTLLRELLMGHRASARWLGLGVALRLLERIALAFVAYAFVTAGSRRALATALGAALLFAARAVVAGRARAHAQSHLHAVAVDAVLRSDAMRATAASNDDVQMAMFEGIHNGSRFLAEVAPDAIADAVASMLLAAFLATLLPARLVFVGGAAIVCATAALAIARRTTSRTMASVRRAYVPLLDDLVASVGARVELVASGRDDAFRASLRTKIDAWERAALRGEMITGLAGRGPLVVAGAVMAAGIVLDAGAGSTAVGAAALLASAAPAFLGLARGAHEIVRTRALLKPFLDVLERRAPLPSHGVAPPAALMPIAWEGVSYTYPDAREPAVHARSIAWRPGTVLVLAGANGAGKSTLLRLLVGLAAPSSGRITVGDVDLRTLDARAWRRRIAFLPQRPYLPERGTVREAVHLLVPDADDARIEAALARVELLAKLRRAGDPLAARIAALSVGEKQRVALARALVQDAPILLLDEPDANLDAAGITLVARIVRELARDRMIALAAHTPAIVDVADHLVSLDAP